MIGWGIESNRNLAQLGSPLNRLSNYWIPSRGMDNRGAEKHHVREDSTSSNTQHLPTISMCTVTGCPIAAVIKIPAAT
jgi:hypothetical protein